MVEPPIPIAIIGMACRFPGGVNSTEKFWDLLASGHEPWSDVPPDRFNWKAFHHSNPDAIEANNHRGGHFLSQDLSAFDAKFFGIPSQEAEAMDPQHRIQLEVAYEALQNAGITLESIKSSDTGVYVAVFNTDYQTMLMKDTLDLPKYQTTGTGPAIASNRISYTFDLRGPSFTLDTGCSGSMVALHQACQSLLVSESHMALVGGSNVILNPDAMDAMSKIHMLNPNGRSYSFDHRGSGYGRGEGAGMVVLKRLSDALHSGDPVRAIIRNTGINQDGRTNGITLPSQESQRNLIHEVYVRAGLEPQDTGYIEAHGTGTVAGDTKEIGAITDVFCRNSELPEEKSGASIAVGSLKANIGHTESTAGIAALIKAVLVLEKAEVPPNFPSKLESLHKLRVSINSFGYGGTNAHAILDGPSKNQSLQPRTNRCVNGSIASLDGRDRHSLQHSDSSSDFVSVNEDDTKHSSAESLQPARRPYLFVISAQSEASLSAAVRSLQDIAFRNVISDNQLEDLAYTLGSRRDKWRWRSSVVASSCKDFGNPEVQSTQPRRIHTYTDLRTIFIFTGQGAQWFAMGRQLLVTYPCFNNSMQQSESILQKLGAKWDLVEELLRDEDHSRIHQSEIGQPACTAIQIALVELLESFAIKPNAVVGHSSGEIAAAFACGALSHYMAMMVSYKRGLLPVSEYGAMASIALGEVEAERVVGELKTGRVCIACVNSPSNTTVSGDQAAIEELERQLAAVGVPNKRLKVDTAFHSHHMQRVSTEYYRSLEDLQSDNSGDTVSFFSTVTGKRKVSRFDQAYWTENLVSKVRFSDALEDVYQTQATDFARSSSSSTLICIECGPHSALSSYVSQTLSLTLRDTFPYQYLSCLKRRKDAAVTLLDLTGHLFELGYPVDLSAINSLHGSYATLSGLEPYSWDHCQTYWHESRLSKEHRFRRHGYHELLGLRKVDSVALEPSWRNILSLKNLPWLEDHAIDGIAILPGSAYLCMAMEALRQMNEDLGTSDNPGRYLFQDVFFKAPLAIPILPAGIEVQLSLREIEHSPRRPGKNWKEFHVFSLSQDNVWHENCRGFLQFEPFTSQDSRLESEDSVAETSRLPSLEDLNSTCTQVIDVGVLYNELRERGNHYGPAFTRLKKLRTGGDYSIGSVDIASNDNFPSPVSDWTYLIHPTTLDALLHASIPLYMQQCSLGSVMTLSIPELSVTSSDTHFPNSELLVASNLIVTESGHARGEIAAFRTSVSAVPELMVHFTKSEFRGIGQKLSSEHEVPGHPCIQWGIRWELDVNFISPEIFATKPVADGIAFSPEEKLKMLDRLATLYVHNFFEASLQQSFGAPNDHRAHLLGWMQQHMSLDSSQKIIKSTSTHEFQDLRSKVRKAGAEGEIMYRIGENLLSILVNGTDPLPIMLEGDLLYRLYADDASTRCYDHLIDYFRLLLFKNPYMAVLEIGAGTGGTTLPLLESVSKDELLIGRYDFTDISLGFFEHAQALLAKWTHILQYKTLDISKDAVGQGFVAGEYDLVIASNVLHTTPCIDDTLANVRRLLKPGGVLLLIEVTRTTAWYNTCFGCLPGWWAGVNDGRTESPLLSQSQWNGSLIRSSFNGVETAAHDFDGPARRSTLMVSRAISESKGSIFPALVITGNTTDFMQKTARNLIQQFEDRECQSSLQAWPVSDVSRDIVYVVLDSGDEPLLANLSPELFLGIKSLVTKAAKIIWVTIPQTTKNPEKGLITGLARTARVEDQALKFITLDIQDKQVNIPTLIADIVQTSFYGDPASRSKEVEYLYRNGQLLISRLIPDEKVDLNQGISGEPHLEPFHQPDRPLRLFLDSSTRARGICFSDDEDVCTLPLQSSEVEIEVVAWSINLGGNLHLLGQDWIPGSEAVECAGVVSRVGLHLQTDFRIGDRVCAWGKMLLSSNIRVSGSNICQIPASMSFAAAATIPMATLTAYYGLTELANLKKGQTLLIHLVDSNMTEAALRMAQEIGARVLMIVDDAFDKQRIMEEYHISDHHILSHRSQLYQKQVQELTAGKGFDAALVSPAGDSVGNLLESVATFGTVVALGKCDNIELFQSMIARNIKFTSLDFSLLCEYRREALDFIMTRLISKFESKEWSPTKSFKVIPISEIEDIVKFAQGPQLPARIVLESNAHSQVKVLGRKAPASQLREDATYVVAGGRGGIGSRACKVLARWGAKHLVLISRKKVDDEDLRRTQNGFRDYNIEVRSISCDITDLSCLRKMVSSQMSDMPPVRGVIQSTMVLKPSFLRNMSFQDFQLCLNPKLQGTQALSTVFDPLSLDFFVLLSSSGNLIGNKGQANYAAGNTFQDAFANEAGPETNIISVDLGWWEDTPAVTKSSPAGQGMIREGFLPLKNMDIDRLLEYSISRQAREEGCRQFIVGFNRKSLSDSENDQILRNPMFASLPYARQDEMIGESDKNRTPCRSIEEKLSSTVSVDEAQHIIGESVLQKVAILFSVRESDIGLQSSIADFGADSFVMIELRNWIMKVFKSSIQVTELGDARSIMALAGVIAERSEMIGGQLDKSR